MKNFVHTILTNSLEEDLFEKIGCDKKKKLSINEKICSYNFNEFP
jgi:hypothetical protein